MIFELPLQIKALALKTESFVLLFLLVPLERLLNQMVEQGLGIGLRMKCGCDSRDDAARTMVRMGILPRAIILFMRAGVQA